MFAMRSLMPVCGSFVGAALVVAGGLQAQEKPAPPEGNPAAAESKQAPQEVPQNTPAPAPAPTGAETPPAAEAKSLARTVKVQADACSQASLRGDFEASLPFVPKKLMDLMGGRDALKKMMEQGQGELKRRGVTIDSATTAMPEEPKNHGGLLVTLVPTTTHLTTPQGKVVATSHLIAISEDGGERWVFADTATVNEEKLATLYPALKGKVKIPAATARMVGEK
ncbi:hypothetical protein OKA04_12125 [Luteolibacter flavescens]|uniref:Uncharacterized protein n=1 Tax=Luteolibacter flavescens TaxID=1859460 RepID=A0ABT3FPG9_9BACT|nr:hypothetical protein [Luteolibacter flavescens]MCW1885477.1 hypothetical protein [Luteolibacter flavescens]